MTSDNQPSGWQRSRIEKAGTGDWRAFKKIPMEKIHESAASWKRQLSGVTKPWLCWNLDNRWCLLQQKLILETGWTPVVGWDPNCGLGRPEKLAPGAIAIDFNELLDLPVMFSHFPIEFVFLWTERLAFRHAAAD